MLSSLSRCVRGDDAYDGFSVVSEYFGRGLFNKLTVVTEAPEPSASPSVPSVPSAATVPSVPVQSVQTYGPGAEAKLRLQEGQSTQVYVQNALRQVPPKGTAVIPVPEGKMRLLEQQHYSSSLEANMTKLEPRTHKNPIPSPNPPRKKVELPQKISTAISNDGRNPFDQPKTTYDESKNPFADEENDATNPFAEDDYDNNLNPFS